MSAALEASAITILPAPIDFTATAVSASQINLAWTDQSANETGFKIERSTDNTTFTTIATTLANVNAYSSGGLLAGTVYYYRISAINLVTASSAVTASTITIPAAPGGLAAVGTSPAQITLNWTDVAGETGYKVERSPDGTTGWTQIGITSADFTTFADSSLNPATTYYYRVRAFNGSGDSGYSAVASGTTLTEAGVSTGPQLLMTGVDINAVAGQAFDGTVAYFSLIDPGTDLGALSASIDWGDGNTSPGTFTGGGGSFQVRGSHTYDSPDVAPVLVQVQYATGDAASVLSTATVTDPGPTVATAAAATVSDDGASVAMSVLGNDTAGEGQLTYHWAVTAGDGSGQIIFDTNNTNDAKNTLAVLNAAGSYTFEATITNSYGQTITSDVTVSVAQQLSDISVTSTDKTVADGATEQFTATAMDQFGQPMDSQPVFTWGVTNGLGTVASNGLYTAPTSELGLAVISATAGGVTGSRAVNLTSSTVFSAVAVSQSEIDLTIPPAAPGTTQELEVNGPSDDNYHTVPFTVSPNNPVFAYTGLIPSSLYGFWLRTEKDGKLSYARASATTLSDPNGPGGSNPSGPPYQQYNVTGHVSYRAWDYWGITETGQGDFSGKGNAAGFEALGTGTKFQFGRTIDCVVGFNGLWTDNALNVECDFQGSILRASIAPWATSGIFEYYPLGPEFPFDGQYGKFSLKFTPIDTGDGGGTGGSGGTGQGDPVAPVAVQNLKAIPFMEDTSRVNRLVWDNTPNNEMAFKVERSSDGGQTYSVVATQGVEVTSYEDPVEGGINYQYKVVTYNAGAVRGGPGIISGFVQQARHIQF